MRDDTGGVLTADLLLRAYASGVFPMAENAGSDEVFWVDPHYRGILPLDGLQVSRRLARSFRGADFEIRIDHAFDAVVTACADRPETWINPEIFRLYGELHRRGHAHSVEIWRAGRLAGGLYGVALGAAFFGEHVQPRAGRFEARARRAGRPVERGRLPPARHPVRHRPPAESRRRRDPRADYRQRLAEALAGEADFHALAPDAGRQEMLQLITQTS